jgi:hypothetical protein
VFWGEAYRRHFLEVCLSALLGPGNLEALAGAEGEEGTARPVLVLCTTADDRRASERTPQLRAAARFAEIRFLDIGAPECFGNKYLAMSHGHRLAARQAFEEKACGIFLTPDMILSAGSLNHLRRWQAEGAAAVLCAAIRFEEEGVMRALADYRAQDGALDLASGVLVDIGVDNLHLEARNMIWHSPAFARFPYNVIFPTRDGAVLHSFSWAPLLLDYSRIDAHDTSTFEHWTLDGDYVDRNFGRLPDEAVYVVRDSDEVMLVSFTREADLHFETKPVLFCKFPWLNRRLRRGCLRWLYHSTVMDDLKRRIFERTVLVHDRDIDPELWRPRIERASEEVRLATKVPAQPSEKWVRSSFFRILWLRYSWRGLVATVKGTPADVEAPLRWRTFKAGFLVPYGRLLRNEGFGRAKATGRRLHWLVANRRTVWVAMRRRLGLRS